MKIVVAGATGFVGSPLCTYLMREGHEVVAVTRDPERARARLGPDIFSVGWDGRTTDGWAAQLNGADAVVNLAGAGIADRRWTAARKQELRDSRLDATGAIVTAIAAAHTPPQVLVNASAIGWYGPCGDEPLTEHAPAGPDFLGRLCAEWEEAAQRAEGLCRVVRLRIGVVLGPDGGALAKMLPPFRFFVGGPLGSGRQQFSWIHRDDLIGLIEHVIQTRALSGAVNATAPHPVPLAEFCRTLGRVLGRPSWAPVPAPVLRLMLGEMADMLLCGQRVLPAVATESGYTFQYRTAEEALRAVLGADTAAH